MEEIADENDECEEEEGSDDNEDFSVEGPGIEAGLSGGGRVGVVKELGSGEEGTGRVEDRGFGVEGVYWSH